MSTLAGKNGKCLSTGVASLDEILNGGLIPGRAYLASDFDKRLPPLRITRDGIDVGDPLANMRGILTGTPAWVESDEVYRMAQTMQDQLRMIPVQPTCE